MLSCGHQLIQPQGTVHCHYKITPKQKKQRGCALSSLAFFKYLMVLFTFTYILFYYFQITKVFSNDDLPHRASFFLR